MDQQWLDVIDCFGAFSVRENNHQTRHKQGDTCLVVGGLFRFVMEDIIVHTSVSVSTRGVTFFG
jgi:hypothetical protein